MLHDRCPSIPLRPAGDIAIVVCAFDQRFVMCHPILATPTDVLLRARRQPPTSVSEYMSKFFDDASDMNGQDIFECHSKYFPSRFSFTTLSFVVISLSG